MPSGTMSAAHSIIFAILLLAVIGFFPVLDTIRLWRYSKHERAEARERLKHERKYWRRTFIWSVFSTKRVPRLTDQSESGMQRQG